MLLKYAIVFVDPRMSCDGEVIKRKDVDNFLKKKLVRLVYVAGDIDDMIEYINTLDTKNNIKCVPIAYKDDSVIEHMKSRGKHTKMYYNVVSADEEDAIDFDSIYNEIQWEEMISFNHPVPRLVAIQ